MEGNQNSQARQVFLRWPIVTVAVVIFAAVIAYVAFIATGSYYRRLGAGELQRGNYEAARVYLARATRFVWNDAIAHALLARAWLGPRNGDALDQFPQRNTTAALQTYQKALRYNLADKHRNLYTISLDDLGNVQWNEGRFNDAVGTFRSRVAISPADAFWARYFIAFDAYNRTGGAPGAIATLLPALSGRLSETEERNIFRVHALLAQLYLSEEDFANAEQYANLAIRRAAEDESTDQNVMTAYNILVHAYGKKRDFTAMKQAAGRADLIAGTPGSNDCVLAFGYFRGKNYEQAIAVARGARLTNSPRDAICDIVLARSYTALGDAKSAREFFERYLVLTNPLEQKNIIILRNRELAQSALR